VVLWTAPSKPSISAGLKSRRRPNVPNNRPCPRTMQQGRRVTTMAPREMSQPKRTLIWMVRTKQAHRHRHSTHTRQAGQAGQAAQAALMGFVLSYNTRNFWHSCAANLQTHRSQHTKGTLVLYKLTTPSYGHKQNGARPSKSKQTQQAHPIAHIALTCSLPTVRPCSC
jgi:hypothetical protein